MNHIITNHVTTHSTATYNTATRPTAGVDEPEPSAAGRHDGSGPVHPDRSRSRSAGWRASVVAAIAVLLALLGSGCGSEGVIDAAVGFGEQALETGGELGGDLVDVVGEQVGVFSGSRPHVTLAVDPGFASTSSLVDGARPLIDDTAREGGTLRVFIVSGQSSARMTPVEFSDQAGRGNFEPSGSNDEAWHADATQFATAAVQELAAAIEDVRNTCGGIACEPSTGSDLFGALSDIVDVANGGPADHQVVAVLLTGGGVHDAGEYSMSIPPVTMTTAPAIAESSPAIEPARHVDVVVAGVGHMPGASTPVDTAWVDAVGHAWDLRCALAGCTVQGIPALGRLIDTDG